MTGSFVIEPLSSHHDRIPFSCGVEQLDDYLKTRANQDIRRNVANCFVAIPESGTTRVVGYYTLAASSVPLTDIPAELARRLPRYPLLPAVLIGRLAVDHRFIRQSLGSVLLYDAMQRTTRADAAVFALIVDAKDETAANFYKRFGFQPFASRELGFFLPMAIARKLVVK